MGSRAPPDYYGILEVGEDATTAQIRSAYKRAALKTHPDRVTNDSPERAERTRKFQLINDAFYTLSDAQRRRDYDAQRRTFSRRRSTRSRPADPFEDAGADQGRGQDGNVPPAAEGANQTRREYHYSWAWDFFSKPAASSPEAERQRAEDAQFQDVFEEMMREEGMAEDGEGRPTGKFWSMLGAVSGGALGFIVANVPGLVAGAVAGNRLGSVRDAKGKSVYEVYQVKNQRRAAAAAAAASTFSFSIQLEADLLLGAPAKRQG